jgi:glucosamine-6-phosphate deaminase
MASLIDPQDFITWCGVPTDLLEGHPHSKVAIRILPTPDDVDRQFAEDMVEEIEARNAADQPTRLILPCGPRGQFVYFARMVNEQHISLSNVHIFHMDDFLDWQGRPLPLDHPLSFRGWMERNFYDPISPELNVPAEQRHWPDVYNIDAISQAIEEAGGVDTTYGGIGYRGHLAFNEPPQNPWYTVPAEEFRRSKTRIVPLNDDTLILTSFRTFGGCSQLMPPMAITLGMRDLLGARRIRLYSETGVLKQAAIRVLLFGPVTTEYPVTFTQEHPDVLLTVDTITAASPPLGTLFK